MLRSPDPSPNGSIIISVDGVVVHTMDNLSNPYSVFPSSGNTGYNDRFVANLFCANFCSSSGKDMELDVDYIRVYTPTGN